MKNKLLLICSILLLPGLLFAQSGKVSGVIYDEDKQPLPMVNILIKGTSTGALSDFDGAFTVDVTTGSVLVFQYIGFEKQEVAYTGQDMLKIEMKSTTSALDEIVVIGYGAKTRKDLLGAVANVSGTDLRKTGITNVSHMIQDAMPGVFAEISSGQPGADDANITIRGASTWNGDNSPLILVDGIEAAGGFSQIDASEIASISVLKDASSTAIYGVKGADGVILITTRRGSKGKPSISASMNVTAKMVADIPDQLGSYDVLMLGQEAYKNSGTYDALRSQSYIDNFNDPNRNVYAYPDVDWYDELVKPVGWENTFRVNASGGTDFVRYFASISNTHLGDVLKNEAVDGYYDPQFSYNKVNFRSNLDFQITKTTRFSVDISGRSEFRKTPNSDVDATKFNNVFKFIDEATPYLFPTYYPNEFWTSDTYGDPLAFNKEGIRLSSANKENPYQANPFNTLNYSGIRKYKTDVVDVTMALNQDLGAYIKGLAASIKFNYSSYSLYKRTEKWDNDSYLYDAQSGKWREQGAGQTYNSQSFEFHTGDKEAYDKSNRNIYYEGQLIYDRSFNNHNVGGIAVFNRSDKQTNLDKPSRLTEDWVGRLTYDYDKRYYIKASAGYNGSDLFAQGKRFGFFPSMALAWNIANENFIKDALGLNAEMLKLRYSYGKVGSETGSDYMYLGGWGAVDPKYSYIQFGDPLITNKPIYAETKLANPDATWEVSYKQNLGLDIVMLRGDLDVAIDIFNERRENIFYIPPMVSYFHPGFGTDFSDDVTEGKVDVAMVNGGSVKNHGLEFEASYGYSLDNGVRLKFGANMTMVESRVIYKGDLEYAPDYQKDAGKPLGWQSGYQTNGYINSFEQAVNSTEVAGGNQPGNFAFADFDGSGYVEANDVIPLEGTSQPLLTYGFRTGFSYKGFDFMVKFFGKEGVYYNASNLYPNFNTFLLEAKTVHSDTWSPSNTNAAYPTYRTSGTRMYEAKSDANLFDSSYLKIQNVSLGYLLKSEYLKRTLHINNVNLTLSGQNLYTWSKIPFGDPEGGNSISGNYGGNYPLVRRIIFDVKLNF